MTGLSTVKNNGDIYRARRASPALYAEQGRSSTVRGGVQCAASNRPLPAVRRTLRASGSCGLCLAFETTSRLLPAPHGPHCAQSIANCQCFPLLQSLCTLQTLVNKSCYGRRAEEPGWKSAGFSSQLCDVTSTKSAHLPPKSSLASSNFLLAFLPPQVPILQTEIFWSCISTCCCCKTKNLLHPVCQK